MLDSRDASWTDVVLMELSEMENSRQVNTWINKRVRESLSEVVALSKDLNNEPGGYLGTNGAEEGADSEAPRWTDICRAWKW